MRTADKEYCRKCGEPTGNAGLGEDSLYDANMDGPYCQECWDALPEAEKVEP
jgi:hypothetical protein